MRHPKAAPGLCAFSVLLRHALLSDRRGAGLAKRGECDECNRSTALLCATRPMAPDLGQPALSMRWYRRARDPSRHAPSILEDMQAAEEMIDEELFAVLERFRQQAGMRNEPSMRSLLAVAKQSAEECLTQRESVIEAAAALEAAQEAERALVARLKSIVDLIGDLPPLPPAHPSTSFPYELGERRPIPGLTGTQDLDGTNPAHRWTTDSPPDLYADFWDPAESRRPTAPLQELAEDADIASLEDPGSGSESSLEATGGRTTQDAAYQPFPLGGLAALFFGQFRLYSDGKRLEPPIHGKAFKVFRYLLANHARPIPKDVLIETFWADSALATGRRGLHQAIYTIRKRLRSAGEERQIVVFRDDAYQINPEIETWTDVDDFDLHVQFGQEAEAVGDLDRARAMYKRAEQRAWGDYLEDTPYEDWAVAERERLHLAYVDIANRLADLLEDAGEISRALDVSSRVLRIDPCDEESHRRAMRCFSSADQRVLAIRQYHTCAEQLDQMYGLAPSPATTELYESLIGKGATHRSHLG